MAKGPRLRAQAQEYFSRARDVLHSLKDIDQEGLEVEELIKKARTLMKEQRYREALKTSQDCLALLLELQCKKEVEKDFKRVEKLIAEAKKSHVRVPRAVGLFNVAKKEYNKGNVSSAGNTLEKARKAVVESRKRASLLRLIEKTERKVSKMKVMGSTTVPCSVLLKEASRLVKRGHRLKAQFFVDAVSGWIDAEAIRFKKESEAPEGIFEDFEERIASAKKHISFLRSVGIPVSRMEVFLRLAEKSLKGRDVEAVNLHLGKAENALLRSKRSSLMIAKEYISRAIKSIEEARAKGIGVIVAEKTMKQARRAFEREEYEDAIEFANLARKYVLRSFRKRLESEESEFIGETLERIGEVVEKDNVDDKGREDVRDLITHDLGIVDRTLDMAKDSIGDLERTYLALRAEEDLENIQRAIQRNVEKGKDMMEAKIMLKKAEDAFKIENYSAVTVLERTVRELLQEENA